MEVTKLVERPSGGEGAGSGGGPVEGALVHGVVTMSARRGGCGAGWGGGRGLMWMGVGGIAPSGGIWGKRGEAKEETGEIKLKDGRRKHINMMTIYSMCPSIVLKSQHDMLQKVDMYQDGYSILFIELDKNVFDQLMKYHFDTISGRKSSIKVTMIVLRL